MVGKRSILTAAVIAAITLIGSGVVTERATRVMNESVLALDHTREVLLAIEQLDAALSDAQADAQAYAIVGSPVSLAVFQQSTAAARIGAARLKALIPATERPDLPETVDAIVARESAILRDLVAMKERGASEADIRAAIDRASDIARRDDETLGDLRTNELRLSSLHASRADEARRFEFYGPLGMSTVAALMLALMLGQVMRTLRAQRMMQEHLQRAVAQEHAAGERAREADQLKDQFLATVSHELRTPLAAIIGWCGLLGTEGSETLLDEGLGSIRDAAYIQSQLIEDLLDVSRIAAGTMVLKKAEVDIAAIVGKAVSSVAPSAQAKGVTLRKRHGVEVATPVLADGTRLEQVVWNLLSNAIKFTPPGGAVDIDLQRVDDRVRIIVSDTGEGIAADLLPHIFDRFRQGKRSMARQGGLGLGLAIVKHLVDLHGGSILVETDGAGKGSTFTVDLPLEVRRTAALTAVSAEASAMPMSAA